MLLKTIVLVLIIKTTKTQIISENLQACEEIITKPQFILESPKYPSNYPDNTTCLYVIKGPYCATNFTLQFLDFNIEDSLGCSADYLQISEKDALCGNIRGIKTYQSQTGVLELKFVSNFNITRRGFKLLVTRHECEEENDNNTGDEGSNNIIPDIVSPGDLKPGLIEPDINNTEPDNVERNDIHPDDVEPNGMKPDALNPNNIQPDGLRPNDVPNTLHPNDLPPDTTPHDSQTPDSIQPRIPNNSLQPCCAKIYSQKRFYLTSKNFPSNLGANECKFTIKRANNNVCRLRLHFKYFNIGIQNFGCPSGYLQIDGKIICACQTGLKLISPFTGNFDTTKTFVLKSFSNNINSVLQGFLIEVIQDECPKKYTPSLHQTHSGFYYYQDQNNRVNWPYDYVARDYNYWNFPQPRIIKHVYYFEVPNFYETTNPNQSNQPDYPNQPNRPRDVEETNYLDTPELQDFTISENDATCRNWGLQDLNVLRRNNLWNSMERCDASGSSNPVVKPGCVELDFVNGYFQSPYFPKRYEHNLNLCYRFKKHQGYCKLKIHMLYFDIENSFNCEKDFLLIGNNFRYCGRSLDKSMTIFDMFTKDYHEIQFITDDDVHGRGFKGIFMQLPCNDWEYPSIPTTPPPITPPPRPAPMVPCSKFIVNQFFTIDLIDEDSNVCDYVIFKQNKDVCSLDLEISEAELPCNNEQLIINGQSFCGPLSGRKLRFDFESDSIKVSYRRMMVIGREVRTGLRINGHQISDDCDGLFPPAARLLNRMQVLNQTSISNITAQEE